MNRYSGPWVLLLGILSAGPVGAGPDPDAATALSQLANQRRDAARKTYEVMWANYREGRASEEAIYRWSLRWFEAERQIGKHPDDRIAACRGHWERMVALEKIVRTLQRSRVTTIDKVSAVEFYRVEAEEWLLQAKEEAKGR